MSPTGRTADGTWQVGVRRTLALDPARAWTLLPSLLGPEDAVLSPGRSFTTPDGVACTVRTVTPGTVARLSWRPPGWPEPATLQLRVIPAATGTTLAVHHERLPDAAAREALRERWTAALEALA